jgi:hypothetical protein
MLKKTIAAGLLLSLLAVTTLVSSADAKGRKCPRGFEDIGGKCVPDPTPGAQLPTFPGNL